MDEKSRERQKEDELNKSNDSNKSIDERVHQQLVYKDNRIIDLNNVILDKERQILDLQERVREHNEVANVKNQAMRIVQQKFEEMNRDKKDMSTETEPGLLTSSGNMSGGGGNSMKERRARSSSPGHVIASSRKSIGFSTTSTTGSSSGTFSPPPVDPLFDPHNKLSTLPDIDGIHRKNHHHHKGKRVTFDLNPPNVSRHAHSSNTTAPPPPSSASASESLEHVFHEISSENALLRQQNGELTSQMEKLKLDYESEIVKYSKDAKTAGLKAKVAATARIKELETSLEEINRKYEDETDRLGEEVATLRSSRNWEIEQNGHLRDQVAHLKEKTHKLTEELDASEKAKRSLDSEVDESKKLMELMVDDLLQAENAINYHINQKTAIFEDIDRLKEAIVAQDRFIEILEADIVIYEQHIGLLRENLGASQIDHRALIKSKAFETKLLALEREKEQSDKKSNEDRLKTKALDKKCRVLVEQNEQLMARLCELEMSHGGGGGGSTAAAETEAKTTRRLADQDERIRQISSALESERDVSQRLREAKEALERELIMKRKQEEASQNRIQMDVEVSRMHAQNQVDEMSVEVEAARKKVSEVMAEVEQLRATNFDLQMHIETAKRTMEELADSNEQLEKQIEKVDEELEEKDEDLKQSTWDVETLTRQNEALSRNFRVELDGYRQGFHETRELSEEVKQLKSELQRQQEVHRAHFEAACSQLDDEDLLPERKTSLEVQQEQYILAYQDKIEQMNREIEGLKRDLAMRNGPAQRKMTGVLEPPRIEEIMVQHVQMVQMVASAPEHAPGAPDHLEAQNLAHNAPESTDLAPGAPDRFAAQNLAQNAPQSTDSDLRAPDQFGAQNVTPISSDPSPELLRAHEQLKQEIEELKLKNQDFAVKMQRVELEAKLSGELNVELGRAMLELEEHNELLRKEQDAVKADDLATGRELELHVMMVQEMTEQIATMQERIDELEQDKKEQIENLEKLRDEATTAQHETQRINSELERALHNLAESEIVRKREFDEQNAAHDAEIRKFSIEMEDARREIADLEAKLMEERVTAAQETGILRSEPPMHRNAPNPMSFAPESQEFQNGAQSSPRAPVSAQNAPEPQEFQNDAQNDAEAALETQSLLQNVSSDMSKLIELKDELEIAVQALKAEIWSLNGQLKASILDREALEDRITELDDLMEKEKKKAIALDVELQEQVDLTERAVRRAAEAENESNQRMAECLEKETRREEMEQAYTRLNEYYNQLQEAYNTIYAQLSQAQTTASSSPLSSTAPPPPPTPEDATISRIIDGLMTILLISHDDPLIISLNLREKLEKIGEKVKRFVAEYDEQQTALDEQRRITVALEERLQSAEGAAGAAEGEAVTTTSHRRRVEELEGEIEWKEEECEGLRRRLRDLEKALEAVAERADESEAARLTTRQADVDSLFRTNAELAHTNVRLQNEIDEMDELKAKILEEKEQLERHVKELEEQVAELMEQHETHLQQTQLLQSTPILSTETTQKLELSENEVRRLEQIEKVLNNRILALEDQNLELEEKYQEIEEEMQQVKAEIGQTAAENHGDDELLEARTEVGRLLDVEKALNMRMEMLKLHNEQLEQKVREHEEKIQPTSSTAQTPTNAAAVDDDWGWGDEEDSEEKKPSNSPKANDDSELEEAKTEVTRLTQIEKVLNKRILALEEQNLELEERLQELEDELAEEKVKKSEIRSNLAENAAPPEEKEEEEEDTWGEWGGDEPVELPRVEPKLEDSDEKEQLLQKTIEELQERVKFQKEVIEKAEQELIETQDKYDELSEAYQLAQQSQNRNEQLAEQLKSQLDQVELEKRDIQLNLDRCLAENLNLEEKIRELTAKNEESDGWNDDSWGEEKKTKEESEELLLLREAYQDLAGQVAQFKSQSADVQTQMTQKVREIDAQRAQIYQKLQETLEELETVKKELGDARNAENAWNDADDAGAWNDNGEIERMRETQTVLEMKVDALNEELMRVKEREIELTEQNAALQSRLSSLQSELEAVRAQLTEAESTAGGGWNDDDDAWNQNDDSEDVARKELESEIAARNVTIARLESELAELQNVPKELETVRQELKSIGEQNGLLKDSEARLLDHADQFAQQMDKYREKCAVLTAKIAELEAEIQRNDGEKRTAKVASDELVTLRQQLADAQLDIRRHQSTISDREGLIAELRLQIAQNTKTIEELQLRLKTLSSAQQQQQQRRPAAAAAPRRISTSSTTATTSRPSSRLSTAASSSFVPEAAAHSMPLQSSGRSAFDVVIPQSGEPLRRRNK